VIQVDVNVLIYAFRPDMPRHDECRAFLDGLCNGTADFGVPEMALLAVVRVLSGTRWVPPNRADEVLAFCDAVRASPNCLTLVANETHWAIFERLVRAVGARGNLVTDAYLAAFALDRDDEWVTADRDFAKFPGLRWRHPWEAQARVNPL
jgi:toxin-antitoxin system PIN domain toxin